MPILASLKLVELKPPAPKAVLNRRRKLIANIDVQLRLADSAQHASANGKPLMKTAREVSQRVSPWWYEQLDGTAILTVRFNRNPLEFAPGKAAIECENVKAVASTLKLIRQAVIDGELDELLAPAKRVRRYTRNKKGAAKR